MSSQSARGSMFVPRSTGGRWVMMLVVAFLIWLAINHPSDAVDLFQAFFGGLGDLANAVYTAGKEGSQ